MRQNILGELGQVPKVRSFLGEGSAACYAQQEASLSGSATDAEEDFGTAAGWVSDLLYKEVPGTVLARL